MRKLFSLAVLSAFGIFLVLAVFGLPIFGSFEGKSTSMFYISEGQRETGSSNIVNSIVWDFRGYDTLGEETVLFTAALAIAFIVRSAKKQHKFSLSRSRRSAGRAR